MLDPYRMIVINIIASIIALGIIVLYKYFNPKKKLNYLLILIIFSLLVCISIFRKGAYESSDFSIHLYRTIDFYKSLSDGLLMPSWASTLNATYGYPLFIFNYPLPYYLIVLFHIFGFSYLTSMKLFLTVTYILSGISMYLFARNNFKNDIAGFISAIFYQFAPYHLIDLHFKVVIGELVTFMLLPFTFYSLQKIWNNKRIFWICLTALSVAGLILSHVVLSLFILGILFIYSIYNSYNKKDRSIIIYTLIPFILGSLCSVYIWLAPFFLTKYTLFSQYNDFYYFPKLPELLVAYWQFGFLYQGHYGELSFLLGYPHLLVILTVIILLIKYRNRIKSRGEITFWLIVLLLLFYFVTEYSKFFWGLFPFLKVTGSHRLLLIIAFISSLLAGYLYFYFSKRKILILSIVLFTIFSTILNWGQRKVITSISDQTLINYVWKSTSVNEGHFYANPIWRNKKHPWFETLPSNHLQVLKGVASIKEIHRTSVQHTYLVNSSGNTELRDNTVYFPGWSGKDNYNDINIYPDNKGLINLKLPKGNHLLTISYKDIWVYSIMKKISLFFILLMLLVLLIDVTKSSILFKRFVRYNK